MLWFAIGLYKREVMMKVSILPTDQKEAEALATIWLKQTENCVGIINKTKKPDVFFYQYDFLIDIIERLAQCESKYGSRCFTGKTPSKLLRFVKKEKQEQIRLFVHRYAQDVAKRVKKLASMSAKQNAAESFRSKLAEFGLKMDKHNLTLIKQQYELLRKLAEEEKENGI